MENPLEKPVAQEPILQVHELARDLAYGAINRIWDAKINTFILNPGIERWNDSKRHQGKPDALENYLKTKWDNQQPSRSLMLSFGYFSKDAENSGTVSYVLTTKAYALLEKPVLPPSAFISYKQDQSSALALLIEARLQLRDKDIEIFIDKNIPKGEGIESEIQKALDECQQFICILGSNTLNDSEAVGREIMQARLKTNCIILPICHNGYTPDTLYQEHFGDINAIVIKQPESAEEYEVNITKLLIRLGYSTT